LDQSQKVVNVLVFGAFCVVAVSRLLASGVSVRTVGHVVALLLIAWLGYRAASSDRLSPAWGIVAFVVGWFWMPVVPLAALWALSVRKKSTDRVEATKPQNVAKEVDRSDPSPRPPRVSASEPGGLGLWLLTLKAVVLALWDFCVRRIRKRRVVAAKAKKERDKSETPRVSPGDVAAFQQQLLTLKVAAEYEGKVKAFNAPLSSVYAEGVIPLLVEVGGRERGIYVESGEWDWPARQRCLRWLGALRTSDREDLEVEIRSEEVVPEAVSFYTAKSPRVLFELVSFLQFRWVGISDFGAQNAQTLRRLAAEYLEREVAEGEQGLETLDRLVVDLLRPAGQILPSTLILIGSFFGEVLIARNGGRWLVRGDDLDDVAVEIASSAGTIEANVFGKVVKLFQNGMEDSMAFMARSIGERLREDSPPA